ncbi:MAG TPA: hypothetical protein VFF59_05335, partial [Anaerolineae bacterium]|nr:hypothetical protein [Anaerolineae bacterium]
MHSVTLAETTYRLLVEQAQKLGRTSDELADELLRQQLLPKFDTVWQRIELHAGTTFQQILGGQFTYEVIAGHVVPDRTNQQIPRSHFEEAFKLVLLKNTIPVQSFRGPSYIY